VDVQPLYLVLVRLYIYMAVNFTETYSNMLCDCVQKYYYRKLLASSLTANTCILCLFVIGTASRGLLGQPQMSTAGSWNGLF